MYLPSSWLSITVPLPILTLAIKSQTQPTVFPHHPPLNLASLSSSGSTGATYGNSWHYGKYERCSHSGITLVLWKLACYWSSNVKSVVGDLLSVLMGTLRSVTAIFLGTWAPYLDPQFGSTGSVTWMAANFFGCAGRCGLCKPLSLLIWQTPIYLVLCFRYS